MSSSEVFLFFSKLLPVFLYPVGSTIAILALAAVLLALRFRRVAILSIVMALAWLWVCSSPIFAQWLAGGLERQFPPVALAQSPSADVAIVLGGIIAPPIAPRLETELLGASTRILHAARLYRLGKVKRVLVAGGPSVAGAEAEGETIRGLLVEWGVPDDAIRVAAASRNTYENALAVAELRKTSAFDSALLVTSATHMPRAIAIFRRAGLPVTASTTHITVVDRPLGIFHWLPDVRALRKTTDAMKEWIGVQVYRRYGYL